MQILLSASRCNHRSVGNQTDADLISAIRMDGDSPKVSFIYLFPGIDSLKEDHSLRTVEAEFLPSLLGGSPRLTEGFYHVDLVR